MTENEHVREVFSNRLKMLRKEKKIKQEQLAEALNIGKSSVGNYEIGTRLPDADVVVALADYFNVSADYLLGRTNDRLTTVDSADKVIKSLSDSMEALSGLIQARFTRTRKNIFTGYCPVLKKC